MSMSRVCVRNHCGRREKWNAYISAPFDFEMSVRKWSSYPNVWCVWQIQYVTCRVNKWYRKGRMLFKRQQSGRRGLSYQYYFCHYSNGCFQKRPTMDVVRRWMFGALKTDILGHRFASNEAVYAWVQHDSICNHKLLLFHEGINHLVSQWRKCINSYGYYVRKNNQFN